MTNLDWIGRSCANGIAIELMNKCKKSITFVAGTTGAIASKELFDVTGTVMATIIGVCTADVTMTGAGATLSLGTSASVTAFIGATAGDAIDAGELVGVHTTPPTSIVVTDSIPQWIYCKDIDLGYAVATDTLSGGAIDFYCLWYPIVEGSTVVPQDTFNQVL
jgi:hypothetical protein